MAEKNAKAKDGKKTEGKPRRIDQLDTIKALMPWLPFVTWIIGATVVTFLLFIFYKPAPSPTITAAYFVIVILGFYILWKSRRSGFRRGKTKVEE